MEFSYFVHHTVDAEIPELAGNLLLEHIYQHNIDHCLHEDVCPV